MDINQYLIFRLCSLRLLLRNVGSGMIYIQEQTFGVDKHGLYAFESNC